MTNISTILDFSRANYFKRCELQGNTTNPHLCDLGVQTVWLLPPDCRMALSQKLVGTMEGVRSWPGQVVPGEGVGGARGSEEEAKVGRPNRGTGISEGCLPMPAGGAEIGGLVASKGLAESQSLSDQI